MRELPSICAYDGHQFYAEGKPRKFCSSEHERLAEKVTPTVKRSKRRSYKDDPPLYICRICGDAAKLRPVCSKVECQMAAEELAARELEEWRERRRLRGTVDP